MPWMPACPFRAAPCLANGRRPHLPRAGPRAAPRPHLVHRANSTGNLHRKSGFDHLLDDGPVVLLTARRIEVDDVQPLSARAGEVDGNGGRIVGIDRALVEVATDQADALAAPDVDRRD